MTEPRRKMTTARASILAVGALLVGVIVGLALPSVFPTLAGVWPGESCTEIHNEYHEIRRELPLAEGDEVNELSRAQFELLERRPDCFGPQDREMIEEFGTFLDQDG